jgi:UMF1 family MFS transporter
MTPSSSSSPSSNRASGRSFLERLGLHRPELRAWAMYDWANSAFMTTVVAAVFPIYYSSVAAATLDGNTATFRFSVATTIALALIAFVSPVLGALADYTASKKKLLALFMIIGVTATAGMGFIYRGDWVLALVLFMIGNIGIYGSFTFYDSLLPHIATGEEFDRVSTAGYALGYLGGGLLLAVNLAWIQKPEWFGLPDAGVAVRLSFVSVAVWWLLFSIPLFRRVPEPPASAARIARTAARAGATPSFAQALATSFSELRGTLSELRRFKQAFLMLLAFLIYNDGIGTMIRMASIYATQIGIASSHLIAALMIVQFVGIPFSFLFGRLAARLGAKRAIFLSLVVYTVISILGYFMKTALHFYVLAFLVGTVQGGSQALSRSLFAQMVPKDKSSEFFGFFSVFEKFAGIFGPMVFALSIALLGSSRAAILSVIVFFVVGALVLSRVDIEEGERVARAAEQEALVPTPQLPV